MPIDDLLSNKSVVIVYPFAHDEIAFPKMGATRLIHEQIESLKNSGHTVNVLSLEDVGSVMSFFIRLEGHIRQKGSMRKAPSSSENKRWQLNLLAIIIAELLSRGDMWFTLKLKNKLKNFEYPSSIIFHYPCAFAAFIKAAKNFEAKVAIYEHNVEWKFFESNIISTKFTVLATGIWKKMELEALRQADHVICASRSDLNMLKDLIDHRRMDVWVPVTQKHNDKSSKGIDHTLKQELDNNFVIGFIGTNFSPNIIAVRNIIDLAKKMLDSKVIFLIVGNISEAFQNDNNIPTNVVFTGYVDDLDSHLCYCDAFLNLKTTSDTGIEIKMYDYLKFDKPIIATQIGSSGFENNGSVIVVENIENTLELLLEMVKKKEEK